jgi:hypothetical protein
MPHDYWEDEDNNCMIRSCGLQGVKSNISDFSGERRATGWCNQADMPPSTLASRKQGTHTDSMDAITTVIESIDTLGLTKKREVESTLQKYGETFSSTQGCAEALSMALNLLTMPPEPPRNVLCLTAFGM